MSPRGFPDSTYERDLRILIYRIKNGIMLVRAKLWIAQPQSPQESFFENEVNRKNKKDEPDQVIEPESFILEKKERKDYKY